MPESQEKAMPDEECKDSGRGGEQKNNRRCIVTRQSEPVSTLVRLGLGPDGTLVPDLANRLPGRGVWVLPDGAQLQKSVNSGLLFGQACRSLKTSLKKDAIPADLVALLDRLLEKRCLERLGLEQKAGKLVTGFDKIKALLAGKKKPEVAMLILATDGADDGKRKIQAAIGADVPMASIFDREALSKALGRDNVVHVLLLQSGGTTKLKADIGRLFRLRGIALLPEEAQGNAD